MNDIMWSYVYDHTTKTENDDRKYLEWKILQDNIRISKMGARVVGSIEDCIYTTLESGTLFPTILYFQNKNKEEKRSIIFCPRMNMMHKYLDNDDT